MGRPQQADVGQHLQFQSQVPALSRPAPGCFSGRPVHAALEAGIAQSMLSAAGNQQRIIPVDQVTDQFIGVMVIYEGPQRDPDPDVFGALPDLVPAAARFAVAGPV